MSREKKVTFIVGGVMVDANGKPVDAQERAPSEATAWQLAAAERERDEARTALAKAEEEGGAAQAQLSTLKGRLETTERQLGEAQGQVKEALESGERLAAQLADVLAELEAVKAQPLLPPDALERIKAAPGVADKYAQGVLDALTAKTE